MKKKIATERHNRSKRCHDQTTFGTAIIAIGMMKDKYSTQESGQDQSYTGTLIPLLFHNEYSRNAKGTRRTKQ